jgi:ankyrin repeat protein
MKELGPKSSLESLRKEAKRWLKALRAKDAAAGARLRNAHPNAPNEPGLRDVQYALARELGLTSWLALRDALGNREAAGRDRAERVATFLRNACPDWRVGGGLRHSNAAHAAARVLARHPEVAGDSIYTAVVCGDLDAVKRMLVDQPNAATKKGGPRDWEPLLYLCATRLPIAAMRDNAVEIARMLLDHGADPNAYYPGGDASIHYTALTVVVGEGEEDAARHPRYGELVQLLLQRGAEPYDVQLFYNTHFHADILWLMPLIYDASLKLGREKDWRDPEWSMIDMGGYGKGARYILGGAVRHNNLALAEWCLTHGASPEPAQPPHSRVRSNRSLYEEAQARGFSEVADLLARFGATATAPSLTPEERFVAACLSMDRAQVLRGLTEHREYLASPVAMFAAVQRDRLDVVKMLLDLGASPEVEDRTKQRPLHVAVSHDAMHVAAFLLQLGVEVDHRETSWGSTPLAWAVYGLKWPMIDLLTPYTRDVWNLAAAGKVERLRELLAGDATLARVAHPNGVTPLMILPDDEARAIEIVELFLAHGADPKKRNDARKTAADLANERGLEEAAELLAAAASD